MSIESFPMGATEEKVPNDGIEGEEPTREVSYDQHMAELRESWARHNAGELSKPSLKNRELSENVIYADNPGNSEVVESITRKVQEEGILSKDDITSLLQDRFHNVKIDQVAEFLDVTGIGGGKDFDVMLPGKLFDDEGNIEETPLSVSWKNEEGDYTLARFSRTKDGSIKGISYSGGEKAGTNVGYQGAGDTDTQTRNHVSLDNGEISKY